MNLIQAYLNSPQAQKVLSRRPGEEGFSLVELVVVIAVLAILSAVAIPAFVGVQANARASAVKNGLVNGVKECIVRSADNTTTAFTDAQSFKKADAYNGYTIGYKSGLGDSCYGATAAAINKKESGFSIELNPSTGVAVKDCTDPSAPGCPSDKKW